MTENEAIKILDIEKQCLDKSSSGQCKIRCADCKMNIPITYQEKAIKVAISALKEIQQYREIGTVENIKLWCGLFGLKEFGELDVYRKIGTVEECREAREKQISKKCIEDSYPDHTHYKCPSCGKIQQTKYGDSTFGCILNNCSNCGQALEMEVEDD